MAANPNVGTDPQAGAGSTPSEPVSPQVPAPIESDVTKLLAGLGEKFDGLQKELRGLQGRQDKSENNFQAQLARLKQYTNQGMSETEAIAEMQSDDAAEQRWTNLEKKLDGLADQFASGGTQANGQQAVTKVFEAIGLDVKDPRVASALLTQYKTAEEVELAAYRLQRQIQQSPNHNPAQNPSLNGNPPAGGMSPQQIEEKSTRLLRLYDNYDKNEPQIKALEKEIADYWAAK